MKWSDIEEVAKVVSDHPYMRDPSVPVSFISGPTRDGRLLAIAFAQDGAEAIVLDVEVFARDDFEGAIKWFDRVKVERPWIERQ